MSINVCWPGWETVRLIGRGSFGAVYEIERKLFENSEPEKAAMKVISIPRDERDIEELYNDAYDEESITSTFRAHMESIMAEYTLMRKMNGCSNIVNCDDVMYVPHVNGVGWDILIKMELLTSLPKAVPLEVSDETVVQIAVDMCEALELCDKHDIIHRDIKPQNIFVSRNGDYKLGDFGIAKTVEQTMGGTEIGTYRYMAPEVYNHLPYGKTADIYSLGLVLYWLLNERRMPFLPLPPVPVKAGMDDESRKRRFSGETLPAPKNGSGELKRIVLKACAFDPKDRYQTALEMQEDLERLSGRSVPEPDPAPEVVKPEPEVTKPARKEAEPVTETAVENKKEPEETVTPVTVEQKREAVRKDDPVPVPDVDRKKPKRKKIIRLVVIAACTVLLTLAGLLFGRGEFASKVDSHKKMPSQIAANVLMQENYRGELASYENISVTNFSDAVISSGQFPVFESDIPRSSIVSVTFLDTLKSAPADAWDVSAEQNGLVLAWAVPDGKYYDLYIAGDGGVNGALATKDLFFSYYNLREINFNDNFYTEDAVDMSRMFLGCLSLQSVDARSLDTFSVSNMKQMFSLCGSIRTLDISNFDTSSVTDMSGMFKGCGSIQTLDVSNFDTSSVTDMSAMFRNCDTVQMLDVSNFDTSSVTDMDSMFRDCRSLEELDVSGFDTSAARDLSRMFSGCDSLTNLDVSHFDVSNAGHPDGWFIGRDFYRGTDGVLRYRGF